MNFKTLQFQYDRIYSYFKTTTEPYDFLEWDGHVLEVWLNNEIVEKYPLKDIKQIMLAKNSGIGSGKIILTSKQV